MQPSNGRTIRQRLAFVQRKRQRLLDAASHELFEHDDGEITARVEAIASAAATAALKGVARASHHDVEPESTAVKSHWLRALFGAIAALTGIGALAKALADAIK